MATDKTDKSLAALFSDLTHDAIELVRKEIALARSEMSEKLSSAQSGLGSVAAGGAVILAGLLVLLQAIVNGLAMVLPPEMAPWLSPLIVGLVVLLIGYLMLRSGRARLQGDKLVPRRTIDSLRRDKIMVAQEVAQ